MHWPSCMPCFLASEKDRCLKHHVSIVIMSVEYFHPTIMSSFPVTNVMERSKHSNRTVILIERYSNRTLRCLLVKHCEKKIIALHVNKEMLYTE